jgi:hypothetical protein
MVALFKIFHCYFLFSVFLAKFIRWESFLRLFICVGPSPQQNPQTGVMMNEVTGSDENLAQIFEPYVGFELNV